jgi:pimeloyl-ACP methyl ester carboxylesterase
LYRPQFSDAELSSTANLLAIELYGHGATRSSYEHFTYWDSAIANLQVLEALGISEAFVLGTSQGGWIAARMAMLAPKVIKGIVPLGTSMDNESQRSRDLGCWDGIDFCTPTIDDLSAPVDDSWAVPTEFVDAVLGAGLGDNVSQEEHVFWHGVHQNNYSGDAGRKRLRTATINLRDRDGLHARLDSVFCPVLWLQGTADAVFSVPNAEQEIKMFVNSKNPELRVIENGQHFLSASDPHVVNPATAEFIRRWK